MARLGPFGAAPVVAVGCSGGGDSMALAWLAHHWAQARGGHVMALVVDHGLRPESGAESMATAAQLSRQGIAARRLVLAPPPRGPDISAAARAARHATLAGACRAAAMPFLLLGHTLSDQAETLLWRHLRGSGAAGLAGMAARREAAGIAVLRPLLGIAPGRLRATCRAAGLGWIEDPTNADARFARPRLRALLADPAGQGAGITALAHAATADGLARARRDAAVAEQLAATVTLRPEGFAVVAAPDRVSGDAAARLVGSIGGRGYPPAPAAAAALLRRGGGTLAGVVATPAGRLGAGLLLAREPAAVAQPAPAAPGATWDGRWRLPAALPPGLAVGALGAARVPGRDRLPAPVAAVLPAFRDADGRLVAVPALGWGDPALAATRFAPTMPAADAPFMAG
jgi:tRNA(Ile)-lysidine synthase